MPVKEGGVPEFRKDLEALSAVVHDLSDELQATKATLAEAGEALASTQAELETTRNSLQDQI